MAGGVSNLPLIAVAHPLGTPSGGGRKWWVVPLATNATRRLVESEDFNLNIPEHLPSSPLCPMNPMHKSGGTGVCVYHGRRKTAFLAGEESLLDGDNSSVTVTRTDS